MGINHFGKNIPFSTTGFLLMVPFLYAFLVMCAFINGWKL